MVLEPLNFYDDEPLLTIPDVPATLIQPRNVTIKSLPEIRASAASESLSKFAVLVGTNAPALLDDDRHLERAPLDLVMVLDISGSMSGAKLAMVKRAAHFVVDNLSAYDRLSIVAFNLTAQSRMKNRGREEAKRAMDSLIGHGGTNIVAGLTKGAQVLEDRRERNPVSSIILLSDGRNSWAEGELLLSKLPSSICPANRLEEEVEEGRNLTVPVHTFGFGSDHDASAMHTISDSSGGMFASIQSIQTVQDGFTRCIGGLLSVVAQEVKITVRSGPGVEIKCIPSGKYSSEISEEGGVGKIIVGDLYVEEKKDFLVYVSVPAAEEDTLTLLLEVMCSYKDTVLKEIVNIDGGRVDIYRPKVVNQANGFVSLEVDRQKNRISVSEAIEEARKMAESGDLLGAQGLLTRKRAEIMSSASAQAGDPLIMWLANEIVKTREKMVSSEVYETTVRSFTLSGLSSHSWQRATTTGSSSTSGSRMMGYMTPNMVTMVSRSQNLKVTLRAPQLEVGRSSITSRR